jgi:hypothetical protein
VVTTLLCDVRVAPATPGLEPLDLTLAVRYAELGPTVSAATLYLGKAGEKLDEIAPR